MRAFERDKNHPSIMSWSLGNESGTGANLAACARWIHERTGGRAVVHYEGDDLVAGVVNGKTIATTQEQVPDLKDFVGMDIICSDGSTLLSADDKAGVAEICALLKRLGDNPELAHPTLKIAFVPDEEIGHGASCLTWTNLVPRTDIPSTARLSASSTMSASTQLTPTSTSRASWFTPVAPRTS